MSEEELNSEVKIWWKDNARQKRIHLMKMSSLGLNLILHGNGKLTTVVWTSVLKLSSIEARFCFLVPLSFISTFSDGVGGRRGPGVQGWLTFLEHYCHHEEIVWWIPKSWIFASRKTHKLKDIVPVGNLSIPCLQALYPYLHFQGLPGYVDKGVIRSG